MEVGQPKGATSNTPTPAPPFSGVAPHLQGARLSGSTHQCLTDQLTREALGRAPPEQHLLINPYLLPAKRAWNSSL